MLNLEVVIYRFRSVSSLYLEGISPHPVVGSHDFKRKIEPIGLPVRVCISFRPG